MKGQTLGQLFDPLAEVARARTRAIVSVDVEGNCIYPEAIILAFLRIAQESLNNIAKHAEATKVDIDLVCATDDLVMTISDDGRGFDLTDIAPGHIGIGIMLERAQKIGADLKIESDRQHGTTVTTTWFSQKEETYHE